MTASAQRLRIRACAKINLTLRVLGIRADGYHELRTTFQSLALHDTLTFERVRGPFAITTDDPRCPTDQSNLVWTAAIRLWEAAGRAGEPAGVRVHIRKRIPSEAGLGGGSSDAAAALRALPAIWRMRSDGRSVEAIARALGADVAFFLVGGTALGVDRGDLLFPLAGGVRAWVVLARPDFGVSTRDAYGWWDRKMEGEGRRSEVGGRSSEVRGPGRRMPFAMLPGSEWVNDLQAPVVEHHPRIAALVKKLQGSGALYAAMSGSGSAVFGLFVDRTAAATAAARLSRDNVQSWVTRTTSRAEFARASGLEQL